MSKLLEMTFRPSIFTRDLAISAVPYDSMLVAELSEHLTPMLGNAPYWPGNAPPLLEVPESHQLETTTRLVVILFQRLWPHDPSTQADAAALRRRLEKQPGATRLVVLDAEPVPEWLAAIPQCRLSAAGLNGVVDFVAQAVVECGGSSRPAPPPPPPSDAGEKRWLESTPFLSQRRAIASLRHELDALGAELQPYVKRESDRSPDRAVQLHTLPSRFLVQIGSAGLSFSWVPSGLGNVADGRLLVIEWSGLLPRARGLAALKSASPSRERVYVPEASDPGSWKWRHDHLNGRAYSTANLVREWLAGMALATTE
jgi:hypothetical protein